MPNNLQTIYQRLLMLKQMLGGGAPPEPTPTVPPPTPGAPRILPGQVPDVHPPALTPEEIARLKAGGR